MKKNILTINDLNKTVTLNGWVNKVRKLGNLVFVDLRNINGITQIVFDKKNKNYSDALNLRNEYVISIDGKVVERKNKNLEIESGEIEIIASSLKIISDAQQTPLIIDDNTDALEKIRNKYRYLDLRRPINQNTIIFRSHLNKLIRDFFYEENFIEIETPVITKPTIGGADELKVYSKNSIGKEFSLVQSPQIYKQLLMYSGFEKYFQIAKCFRDEDSRSDRQLEFTQLDLEISFVNEETIINLIERLIMLLWKKLLNIKINPNFKKISYKDAFELYGSDKPDLRIKNKIFNLEKVFNIDTKINFISSGIKSGKLIKGLFFEEKISNSLIKKEENILKSQGCSGVATLYVKEGKIESGTLKSISDKELKNIINLINKKTFTMFLIIDNYKNVHEFLGRLRNSIANSLNLFDKKEFSFCWVVDWPLFELDKNNKITYSHNPFTSPDDKSIKILLQNDKINVNKLLNLKSKAYDLVLNGNEIGGGAIRINNLLLQEKVINILYENNKDLINENFSWFFESQKFGIPNHGGIAIGIDRLISLMLNKESIKDVIAFPKSTKGTDELTGAPIDSKR